MLKSAIATLLALTLTACNSSSAMRIYSDTGTNQATVKQQTWLLDAIDGIDAVAPATLRIADNLSASGRAGCNNFNGQGEIDGNRFRIRQMAMTRKLCEPQIMQVEQVVSRLLSGWSELRLSGNRLILQNDTHKLIFRPE